MAGPCVQSKNHPANYGNNEECSIVAWAVAITVDAFSTESEYDVLTMSDGIAYSGTSGPPSGTYSGVISWSSDHIVTSSGWKLCKATTTTTTLPSGACAPPLGVHDDVDTSSCSGVFFPPATCTVSCAAGFAGEAVIYHCYEAEDGFVGAAPWCTGMTTKKIQIV